MAKGPKTDVVKTAKSESNKKWICTLECGHTVKRRVRRRAVAVNEFVTDPAPKWVYCKECANE